MYLLALLYLFQLSFRGNWSEFRHVRHSLYINNFPNAGTCILYCSSWRIFLCTDCFSEMLVSGIYVALYKIVQKIKYFLSHSKVHLNILHVPKPNDEIYPSPSVAKWCHEPTLFSENRCVSCHNRTNIFKILLIFRWASWAAKLHDYISTENCTNCVYKATLEPETTQLNSQDRIQTRKFKLETLLIMSTATLKAIRLEYYQEIKNTGMLSQPSGQTCHLKWREDSVSPV